MLRWLSLIVTIPFAAIVVLFAVYNLQDVTISTFPLPFEVTLPLALLVLVVLALGVVSGGLLSWLYGTRDRLAVRRDRVRLAKLEKEMAGLRLSALQEDVTVPPPSSGVKSAADAPVKQLMLPPI